MQGRWFEDFVVGELIESAPGMLSEADIIDFGRTYDPQPFHVDPQAARDSVFGGLIASGWQVGAYAFRLFIDTSPFAPGASLGSPGLEYLKWRRPVRPGVPLRVHVRVTDKRESASKPDRGVVGMDWQVLDEDDEVVVTIRSIQMVRKRPA